MLNPDIQEDTNTEAMLDSWIALTHSVTAMMFLLHIGAAQALGWFHPLTLMVPALWIMLAMGLCLQNHKLPNGKKLIAKYMDERFFVSDFSAFGWCIVIVILLLYIHQFGNC